MTIYHYYSPDVFPNRVSFAGYYDGDILKIAVSRCGDKDIFIRKKGKLITETRLKSGEIFAEIKTAVQTAGIFVHVCQGLEGVLIFNPDVLSTQKEGKDTFYYPEPSEIKARHKSEFKLEITPEIQAKRAARLAKKKA